MTTSRPDSLLWQRWDEVDRLLSEAMDLPPDEGEELVRRSVGDDAALRDLVLRLLDRVRTNEGAELTPREDIILSAFSGEGPGGGLDALGPGEIVGSYRIIGRIGRGGMATVYEAERADGAYDQRVALKVLRRGIDTEDLVRRFLGERQILSSLTHPNIARLLDGGSTSTGRPFLVMELVTGEPITTWADKRRLDIPARLWLFLAVTEAVRAAHRQLVVHRDIKPSNVLVDTEGRVKLLDFGIAKLLDRDQSVTDVGAAALTPQYASPEQLDGGTITTATDVYQLGLLLRELLTGLSPSTGKSMQDQPLRPSRSAMMDFDGASAAVDRAAARQSTPERLSRALRGDLDIILGKARRPDPSERYASADDLAADVARFLAGHPILAHPESAAYRVRKFIGRHPFAVPGAVAAVAALLVFSTVVALQNRRITRERDNAETASQRALGTQDLLIDLFGSPDPTQSGADAQTRDITVVDALQHGRTRLASDLEHPPDVKAALLGALGRTFSGLGRLETADTLLRESLRMQRSLYDERDAQVVGTLRALADNYRLERAHQRADSVLQEVLGLMSQRREETSYADLLAVLSAVRRDLGDGDSSMKLVNAALTLRRTLADTASRGYTSNLAILAFSLRAVQQFDSAEVLYREVIRRQAQMTPPDPDLAANHNNLGYLLRVRGDYAGAEQSYREALRLATETLGAGHLSTLLMRQNLASALELGGKIDDALAVAREQIAAAESEWPQGHWRVGSAHLALGRALVRHGRSTEAIDPLESGVRVYSSTIGPRHDWTMVARADLAGALLIAGQGSSGRAGLVEALAVLRARRAQLDGDSRYFLGRIATVLEEAGYKTEAAPFRAVLDTTVAR